MKSLAQHLTSLLTWTIVLLAILSDGTHLSDEESRVGLWRSAEIKVTFGFLGSSDSFSRI
jgi:hypothetical protein